MTCIGNSIKVLSANCQGLGSKEKRNDVLSFFKEQDASIICLQDTHWVERDYNNLRTLWGNEIYISGGQTNSRGVAILLNSNFEYTVLDCKSDNKGNYLNLQLRLTTITLNLVNVYGPNSDDPKFYEVIENLIDEENFDYNLICGDLNLVLNPEIDSFNYKHINNPRARQSVLSMISGHDLCDLYREFHPEKKRFTWRRRHPLKQARLDYFLASTNILDLIKNCEISISYRSDHSILKLEIMLNKFERGKGIWKFNNSLLENPEYLQLINNIIEDQKMQYAVPVYDIGYLRGQNSRINMTIDSDSFLETLFLQTRGETIKFASKIKKQRLNNEQNLISDIEKLESFTEIDSSKLELLQDKKAELQRLRGIRNKGNLVRSRIQWLHEGEKPTKYFSNLENKNFIEKTIKKIQLKNGTLVTNQKEVLHHIREYYADLFKSRDDCIMDTDLEKLGLKKSKTVTPEELGSLLTVSELGCVLKKMKPNKTPGIDGITAEFLKVFWGKLKYFITEAINFGFMKGQLPISLRQSIITCLPKSNKERNFIKNWRPISLLCVVYKLASGAIAERLKPSLDRIISKCQTGFIKGRQISDSTRLVYDILHLSESKNIPGLLMLIDFEKAFDSLSWKFLYKVMAFFGYSENLIKWIKLFNTDVTAYVLQCGFLSESIPIKRGCRQGGPISPYLFLIGAEILARLIQSNPKIIGLVIDTTEFKLTQFADDTTLILNGSQHSLQAALNVLEIFGSISGLKMNRDKTKIIWIGAKKFSKDELKVSEKLSWGSSNFTLLGLKFSINLSEIPKINYDSVLHTIKREIEKWKYRHLTPFGKITVIKNNIIQNVYTFSFPYPNLITF